MHAEALEALDRLNRGLIDAWKNADSAGDAFNRMGQVAVDAPCEVVRGSALPKGFCSSLERDAVERANIGRLGIEVHI